MLDYRAHCSTDCIDSHRKNEWEVVPTPAVSHTNVGGPKNCVSLYDGHKGNDGDAH